METRRKLFTGKVLEAGQGKPIVAAVSNEIPDYVGDVMFQGENERGKGWLLKDFNGRGRVYWMHDPFRPNLAKASAKVDGKPLYECPRDVPFPSRVGMRHKDDVHSRLKALGVSARRGVPPKSVRWREGPRALRPACLPRIRIQTAQPR